MPLSRKCGAGLHVGEELIFREDCTKPAPKHTEIKSTGRCPLQGELSNGQQSSQPTKDSAV